MTKKSTFSIVTIFSRSSAKLKKAIGLMISVGLIAAFFSLTKWGFFSLDRVQIETEGPWLAKKFLDPKLAELRENLSRFNGQVLWKIDLEKIERELRALSWISSARVTRIFPASLHVQITPAEISFIMPTSGGEVIPIASTGVMLKPVSVNQAPDAPIMSGEQFNTNLQLRLRAIGHLRQIPKDGSFNQRNISEWKYSAKEGFLLSLIEPPVMVKLGEEDVPAKSARISQVLDYLDSHQIEARVIEADLSQKVLVRTRKAF